jgi:hypothetical protein
MVVTAENGKFLTQRQEPKLATVRARKRPYTHAPHVLAAGRAPSALEERELAARRRQRPSRDPV